MVSVNGEDITNNYDLGKFQPKRKKVRLWNGFWLDVAFRELGLRVIECPEH